MKKLLTALVIIAICYPLISGAQELKGPPLKGTVTAKCGNGIIDEDEQCDPRSTAPHAACFELFMDINVVCHDDCTCHIGDCHDGIINPYEDCDVAATPDGCPSGYRCKVSGRHSCWCERIEYKPAPFKPAKPAPEMKERKIRIK